MTTCPGARRKGSRLAMVEDRDRRRHLGTETPRAVRGLALAHGAEVELGEDALLPCEPRGGESRLHARLLLEKVEARAQRQVLDASHEGGGGKTGEASLDGPGQV